MAKEPAGKKPAPRKTSPRKTATRPGQARKPAPAKKAPTKPQPAAKKGATAKTSPKATAKVRKQPARAPEPTQVKDAAQLGLTPKQQRFVDEYLIDLNGAQAAIRAGYSPATAKQIAAENLSKPYLQLAIAEARKRQQERTGITADRVLRELTDVALADPRELVEVRVGCCRCCHGYGHKYQRTVGEMNRDREDWVEKGKNPAEFDEAGGIGFNPLLPPKEDCPICGGDGQARTVLKDTRFISAQAAALYAGAKQTKEGIEIKLHSKLDAIEKLAKHLGLYEKDNQQKTDPLAALLHRLANESGNGIKPVADDPEAPRPPSINGIAPRQDTPPDSED